MSGPLKKISTLFGRDAKWKDTAPAHGAFEEQIVDHTVEIPLGRDLGHAAEQTGSPAGHYPKIRLDAASRGAKGFLIGGGAFFALLFFASIWTLVGGGGNWAPAGESTGPAVITKIQDVPQTEWQQAEPAAVPIVVPPPVDTMSAPPADAVGSGAVAPAVPTAAPAPLEPTPFQRDLTSKLDRMATMLDANSQQLASVAAELEALKNGLPAAAAPQAQQPPATSQEKSEQRPAPVRKAPADRCFLYGADDETGEAVIAKKGGERITYRIGTIAPCVGKVQKVVYAQERFVVIGNIGRLTSAPDRSNRRE